VSEFVEEEMRLAKESATLWRRSFDSRRSDRVCRGGDATCDRVSEFADEELGLVSD
jgi:hypothetical protein